MEQKSVEIYKWSESFTKQKSYFVCPCTEVGNQTLVEILRSCRPQGSVHFECVARVVGCPAHSVVQHLKKHYILSFQQKIITENVQHHQALMPAKKRSSELLAFGPLKPGQNKIHQNHTSLEFNELERGQQRGKF